MVLNPSVEVAGLGTTYSALNAPAVCAQSGFLPGGASIGMFGRYSLHLETAGDNEGVSFDLSTLPNAAHYVSMYIRFTGGKSIDIDWSLDNDATSNEPALLLQMSDTEANGGWNLYGFAFPAGQAFNATELRIRQNGAGAQVWYIDGINVEQKSYWTTFCAGDQPGCEWEGTAHASTSRRYVGTREGGRVYDFDDDYSFKIGAYIGLGNTKYSPTIDQFPALEIARLNDIQRDPRKFSLVGSIEGTSWTNLHSLRQTLLTAIAARSQPDDDYGLQSVRIWYTGATITKEIDAYFLDGLLLGQDAKRDACFFQKRLALQFLAPDPAWYYIGDVAVSLYPYQTVAMKSVFGKIWTAGWYGEWENMSVGAITAGVAGPDIRAIAVGPDRQIYVGGDFINLDGIPACDYIAAYDPVADTWSALGAGLNNVVRGLAFAPNGDLYAVGDFTLAGGLAAGDYVAMWDGAAWNAVGDPDSGGATMNNVNCVLVDQDSNVFIGGDFTLIDGVANASYTAYWDGAAWNALQALVLSWSGGTPEVFAMALAPNGDIYIGGNFTRHTVNNDVNYILRYDGTAYNMLGVAAGATDNGVNNTVYSIAVDRSGTVYLGGAFTSGMNETLARIAKWNNTAFESLGSGVTGGDVLALDIGPDDTLWIGGAFTGMPDLTWVDVIARWRDDSWAAADLDLPAATTVYAITAGLQRPDRKRNYDLWIGSNANGNATSPRYLSVYAGGSARTSPRLIVPQAGATTRLGTFKEGNSANELIFDYAIQDDDTVTIDLRPDELSVTSDFFGQIPSAILPSSDFASFTLLPTYNHILSYMPGTTAVVSLVWRMAYDSID
jgi:hypothetical protein